MGVFTILMVVSMVWFYDNGTFGSLGIIFIVVVIGAYLVPLFLHIKTVKFVDFAKGILYVLFMTPTFINVNSIYAVCNIHDVSWGSRPVGTNTQSNSARDAAMSIDYQNYRSWFLVIWILINNGVGFLVVFISRTDQVFYLFLIGAFLLTIVGFKIFLSILHQLSTFYTDYRVNSHLKKKQARKEFDPKKYNCLERKRLLAKFKEYEYRKEAKPSKEDEDEEELLSEIRGSKKFIPPDLNEFDNRVNHEDNSDEVTPKINKKSSSDDKMNESINLSQSPDKTAMRSFLGSQGPKAKKNKIIPINEGIRKLNFGTPEPADLIDSSESMEDHNIRANSEESEDKGTHTKTLSEKISEYKSNPVPFSAERKIIDTEPEEIRSHTEESKVNDLPSNEANSEEESEGNLSRPPTFGQANKVPPRFAKTIGDTPSDSGSNYIDSFDQVDSAISDDA